MCQGCLPARAEGENVCLLLSWPIVLECDAVHGSQLQVLRSSIHSQHLRCRFFWLTILHVTAFAVWECDASIVVHAAAALQHTTVKYGLVMCLDVHLKGRWSPGAGSCCRFVPSVMRNRSATGDRMDMQRRDENSVRVTNLSEDTGEDDLRVGCLQLWHPDASSA